MLIFPSPPPSAMQRLSEEGAIESISSFWGVEKCDYTFRGGCDELAMPWQGNT